MASTSISLGTYWEKFIQDKVASGRYGSVTEVIREALRHLEEREQKMEALKNHLLSSESDIQQGKVDKKYSIDTIINELNEE
jgi:antitoxin ParD1/3/4